VKPTPVAARCRTQTAAGAQCRRRGNWTVPTRLGFYCHQHGQRAALARGEHELHHIRDARTVTVTRPASRRAPTPLPVGEQQVLRELRRARTAADLERVQLAIAQQMPTLLHAGTLPPPLADALHAAHDRFGRTA